MINISEPWQGQPSDGRNFALALACGLAVELVALALFLPFMAKQVPPAQIQAPVKLTIASAPPVPKPPLPAPKPPPLTPKPPPRVTPPPTLPQAMPKPPPPLPPPPHPRPSPTARPHPLLRPTVHRISPAVPTPHQAISPPPKPVASPPPPAPAPPSAGEADLFRDAVRRAVQQVANQVYPPSGQESGTVEITITYLNGRAIDVALARSSGFPLLDAAALRAGQIALYPPPPPAFANRTFPWTIAVIFQSAAPNVDGD